MLYRIIFSLVPLVLMPFLNYSFLFSATAAFLVFMGMILGNKTVRVSRIQNLTLFLFYVVLVFGYFQDTTGTMYGGEVLILAAAQAVSGFYGFLHHKKLLAVAFSLLYWTLVGVAIGRIANVRLGSGGIMLAAVLMILVAGQDLRRILKPIARTPFERDGEDKYE